MAGLEEAESGQIMQGPGTSAFPLGAEALSECCECCNGMVQLGFSKDHLVVVLKIDERENKSRLWLTCEEVIALLQARGRGDASQGFRSKGDQKCSCWGYSTNVGSEEFTDGVDKKMWGVGGERGLVHDFKMQSLSPWKNLSELT